MSRVKSVHTVGYHTKGWILMKWMMFRRRWKANLKNKAELHLVSMIGIDDGIETFADVT